jgi:hypothetical protein
MSWREPRDPQQSFPADCETLRELANAYHPFVRYADDERFFPALAEAWLSHTTSAPWPGRQPSGDVGPAETGIDIHRRGTGVCRANLDVTSVEVLGGTPNAHDLPLSLAKGPGDPDAIASYAGVDGGHFLDVGGWVSAIEDVFQFQGREGDVGYLYRAFSELAASVNPAMPWEPVELMKHLPQFWVQQPPTPTVYCEARWAGDFVQVSNDLAEPDFPPLPGGSPIDKYLVLTYHYLYPAREPSDGEPDVRFKEGQWEAVSLFFPTNGKVDGLTFSEPPEWVVVSQGTDGPSDAPDSTDIRRWSEVAHLAAHPVLFVARGSHRFFFEPIDGRPFVPGTGGGQAVRDGGEYDNNSEFPGLESLLIGGLIVAAIIAIAGYWVVAIVVAIIVILLWLISLIADLCNDDAEERANPTPGNPEAGGDGPQGGDPAEPPAEGTGGGAGDPGGGGGDGTFGNPNTGSPSGANTLSFDVRVVDRVTPTGRDPQRRAQTGYPSREPCEQPAWWDYSGRWGVRVAGGMSSTWANGDQRVDEFGRSWGYWHALRVFEQTQL